MMPALTVAVVWAVTSPVTKYGRVLAVVRAAPPAKVVYVAVATVGVRKERAAAFAMVWAELSVIVVPLTAVTIGVPETPAPERIFPMAIPVASATVSVALVVVAAAAVVAKTTGNAAKLAPL